MFGLGFGLRPATPGLGCWGVCVFMGAPRLSPATPGWAVWCGCVCLGSGLGCAPSLLAWVFGRLCPCALVACTPPLLAGVALRMGVFGLGFGLRPATPGWGVGVCVCVCGRAPLVPRHSWLGCAVWVRVLGLSVRLRPARPGWGVGLCLCLWAQSACTPPLLAGVCRVGVCLGLGSRLRPASPSWGVGVCLCLCARSACTPPLSAEVCGVGVCAWARNSAARRHFGLAGWGVFVFVCALRLYPATPGLGVRCGRGCLSSDFGCTPPLLAGVLGCVCVCGRAPLVPRHSWLGCAVRVCVLGLGFRLRPASPGWVVRVCVFVGLWARDTKGHSGKRARRGTR